MNESFLFYKSWLDIILEEYAESEELQQKLISAIVVYGITGEKTFPAEKMFLKQCFAQIDTAKQKYEKRVENARKAGRAGTGSSKARTGNQNATKHNETQRNATERNETQQNTTERNETQPNDNVNVNVNDNDNDNDINIIETTITALSPLPLEGQGSMQNERYISKSGYDMSHILPSDAEDTLTMNEWDLYKKLNNIVIHD